MHPFVPFITEEVYSWVFASKENIASIHIAPWPDGRDFAGIPAVMHTDCFNTARVIMRRINRLRTEQNLPYKEKLDTAAINEHKFEKLETVLYDIRLACRVKEIVLK